MIKSKWIDKLCLAVIGIALLITGILYYCERTGLIESNVELGYVNRIFDDSYVHRINLQVDDWEAFLQEASEDYHSCVVTIDGEVFENSNSNKHEEE